MDDRRDQELRDIKKAITHLNNDITLLKQQNELLQLRCVEQDTKIAFLTSTVNPEIKRVQVRSAKPGYSPIVTFGRVVWLTGIVAKHAATTWSAEAQTKQVLEHMTVLLNTAGTNPEHLLRVTLCLRDIRTAEYAFRAWDSYFNELGLSEEWRPVRITHQMTLKDPQSQVEVHAEAVLPAVPQLQPPPQEKEPSTLDANLTAPEISPNSRDEDSDDDGNDDSEPVANPLRCTTWESWGQIRTNDPDAWRTDTLTRAFGNTYKPSPACPDPVHYCIIVRSTTHTDNYFKLFDKDTKKQLLFKDCDKNGYRKDGDDQKVFRSWAAVDRYLIRNYGEEEEAPMESPMDEGEVQPTDSGNEDMRPNDFEREREENIKRREEDPKMQAVKAAIAELMPVRKPPPPPKKRKTTPTGPKRKSSRQVDTPTKKITLPEPNEYTEEERKEFGLYIERRYETYVLTEDYEKFQHPEDPRLTHNCLYVCCVKRPPGKGNSVDRYWRFFVEGKLKPFVNCTVTGEEKLGENQTQLRSLSAVTRYLRRTYL
jgi:enamine deaminase RidA (YjgF/YER057c/UK114 family)